jgi:hypothetical protein
MVEPGGEQLRLDQMPFEELKTLAGQLMLPVAVSVDRERLANEIQLRLQLINRLDREALLSIVVWAQHPVARSADNRALVREISQLKFVRYDGLSFDGLIALAQLKGLSIPAAVSEHDLRTMLMQTDGLGGWFARKRRAIAGRLLGKLFEGANDRGDYQFLPESYVEASLRHKIEQQGVMSGIASKLRGAADEYINIKLDEIESRIDKKLDQIDRRLAEWRDREIANRLKIIKITLIGSIIVAVISLIYTFVVRFVTSP